VDKRDWLYWQKRMEEWEAAGTEPTEAELAEMLQADDPPGYTPEEISRIKRHGTLREKMTLKIVEHLKAERDKVKLEFFKRRSEK
jgi:hypothetical protein